LRRISQAADEALQTKLGFLANLSHEIRAPLGIMINGVELVLRGLCGDVSDDMREVLDMVKTSGSHLLELVNDVLDFAKVNAGLLERQPEVVDIDDLLVDVQKIIRPIADKKRHSLENLTSPGALSVEVDGRFDRF
jgi:signal transduction histidine kinase